jgi:hypothetical protein
MKQMTVISLGGLCERMCDMLNRTSATPQSQKSRKENICQPGRPDWAIFRPLHMYTVAGFFIA